MMKAQRVQVGNLKKKKRNWFGSGFDNAVSLCLLSQELGTFTALPYGCTHYCLPHLNILGHCLH